MKYVRSNIPIHKKLFLGQANPLWRGRHECAEKGPKRSPSVSDLGPNKGPITLFIYLLLTNGKNFASMGGLMYRVPYFLLPSEYRLAQSSRGFLI